MSDTVKPMRFGLIFAGLLFFCNPYLAAVDVLPDFIGCFLICLGLMQSALLFPFCKEAQKAFLKLAAVDVVKNILLMIVFGAGSGTAEQPTALLVIAFSAAVLDLFFLIPALRLLFDAFYMLASRCDAKPLYANLKGELCATDKICRWSMIFVVVREVICLLPELTALTTSSFDDSYWDNIYDFIGVMRFLACTVVAICGLVWVVFLTLYFKKLNQQRDMREALGATYRKYYDTHPGVAVKRRQWIAFAFLAVGALLLTDFYVDFQNIIPDWLAGALIGIGALILAVSPVLRGVTAVLACAFSVLSYVSSDFAYAFMSEFSLSAIGKSHDADLAYQKMWLSALAEFAVFLALLVCVLLLLRAVIRTWAGYRAECSESEFEQLAHRQMLEGFDANLLLCSLFGFLSALLSFLYDYVKVEAPSGFKHVLQYLWIFDFSFAIAFAVVFGVLLTRIYGQIKNRYQYD